MIWAPYFERNTIISTTCVVRYAYICADVAIIEDYCYTRCLPVSRAAPHCHHYHCSQQHGRFFCFVKEVVTSRQCFACFTTVCVVCVCCIALRCTGGEEEWRDRG